MPIMERSCRSILTDRHYKILKGCFMKVVLKKIKPLEFETLHSSITEVYDGSLYEARIERALNLAKQEGLSHLVVYADREHFANLHYFTGFDPRFEEALLLLTEGKKPLLLVGNEGFSYCKVISFDIDIMLYYNFNLAGMPRFEETIDSIQEAFDKIEINEESRVGLVGWKFYDDCEGLDGRYIYDVPHYIVESLKKRVKEGRIENATSLLSCASKGLRSNLEAQELAVLEVAGTMTSRGIYNLMKNLKPGIREIEAAANLNLNGNPLVAHPNVNFTLPGIRQGLASPKENKLEYGSVWNAGLGYRGAMVARTGVFCASSDEVKEEFKDVWEKAYIPYFKIMAVWYETVAIGVTGKHVVETIQRKVPEYENLGIALNFGHLTHSEEWTDGLFTLTKGIPLRSGMAIQCDIISNPPGLPGVHVEDGLALADEKLRAQIKADFPESWQRIEQRRKMMKEVLGINISDDILPFSDIQGVFHPWAANLETIMAIE